MRIGGSLGAGLLRENANDLVLRIEDNVNIFHGELRVCRVGYYSSNVSLQCKQTQTLFVGVYPNMCKIIRSAVKSGLFHVEHDHGHSPQRPRTEEEGRPSA